jgi:hypothetical protein
MPGDPRAAAEQAPFPLFGLTAEFTGSRGLNGVGWSGDLVNHVTLSHGLLTEKRVDVSVVGPLHGRVPGGGWSIDPLAMIAGELLNQAGVEFAGGAELERGAQEVLRHGFEEGQIRVEGQPWPFRFLRKGDHWAALHDMEPDHLLYIVAGNVAPSDIALERLESLAAYSPPLAR